MRFFFFMLLLSFSFAQEPEITRALDISAHVVCPGNHLILSAEDSAGNPAEDVELRLVRHYPYSGLVALGRTDQNGLLEFILTKNGSYRIYINTDAYNHDDFAEFGYPELCPALPTPDFELSVEPDCEKRNLVITAHNSGPLKDVIITTPFWSSTTSSLGKVVFPLEEGFLSINAQLENYTEKNLTVEIDCTPPECTGDSACAMNQFCLNETCTEVIGECGYAENHSWISYECCEDSDCNEQMLCENNTCIPEPVETINQTNESMMNETAPEPAAEKEPVCVTFVIFLILLVKTSGLPG